MSCLERNGCSCSNEAVVAVVSVVTAQTAAARTTSNSHQHRLQVVHRCGHWCCHHCWHLHHHCCQLCQVVIHALHQLLGSVSLPRYRRVQLVQSIRYCAHRRLQGCKLLFHRTVRVWKAGPDYTVLLPVVIRKSHSVCSCRLVSSLVHISCVFLDQFQFLCTLQNFPKITVGFIFIQFLLEPRVKKPF